MSSIKHFIKLVAFLLIWDNCFTLVAAAQDTTKNLSLNDAIEATLRTNKNIQLAKLDGNIATANYQQTEAIFLHR